MRVWIGCLACYNDGRVIGRWYDADKAGDVTTRDLHAGSGIVTDDAGYVDGERVYGPHEELWVMDVDEAPHPSLCKEMSPADAQAIAEALESVGEEAEPFAAWVDNYGYDLAAYEQESLSLMVAEFEDAYCGIYDSREEYAQELAEELGAVPSEYTWPASYIDWTSAACDLFMDYFDAPAPGGRIYVFRSV